MSTPRSSSVPRPPTWATSQASAPTPRTEDVETNDNRNDEGESEHVESENVEEMAEENREGKRKLKSTVWLDFTRKKVNGVWKAKCNHCRKALSGETRNGTSHLNSHLKTCIYKKKGGKLQTSLRFASSEKGQVSVENYVFDPEIARKALFSMIILHEYPLSIVDHVGFRNFVSALQPLFKMVTRNTVRQDILDHYEEEKKRALNYLQKHNGRVAITTDLWTADNQKRGYMAITGHFVDESWKLKSTILRFVYVPCPHTTDVLAEALYKSLQSWDLDCKVSTLTLDNCSTNDKLVENMEGKIGASNLLLGGEVLHMRCCAHILNLIVRDGLDVIAKAIETIRDSCAYWTATPKRYERFEKTAQQQKVELTKKLCLDCKTRWNSTYHMLSVAIPYKKVFDRLKQLDKNFDCCPSIEDWNFASHVSERLGVFNELTKLFSGTKYVTANTFFPKICEVKSKMNAWSVSEIEIIQDMSTAMITKFEKYWSGVHGLMAIAVILDPRGKMDLLEACYICLFGEDNIGVRVDETQSILIRLMDQYQSENENGCESVSVITSSDVGSSSDTSEVLSLFKTITGRKKSNSVVRSKNELDRYLEADILPCIDKNFDILAWWKVSGTHYPTLRLIARDVFAVPITTVASESAFSTSGRVLSEARSRLTPTLLEALMCCQDWLRNQLEVEGQGNNESFWTCLEDVEEELKENCSMSTVELE